MNKFTDIQREQEKNATRIAWIDCVKGITIMLVIVGHSVHGPLRAVIFSFHMPLFFILSSLTFSNSSNQYEFKKKTRKAFIHLIVPALALFGMETAVDLIPALFLKSKSIDLLYFIERIRTLFFASGSSFFLGDIEVERIGIPWFLFALFLGRTLFDLLHMKVQAKYFSVVCTLLAVAGVVIGQWCRLPMSLDIAFASMLFLLWGKRMKRMDVYSHPWKAMLGWGMIWAITFLLVHRITNTYFEFAIRRYPLFPICYITAIAGTMMISEFSVLFVKYAKFLSKPITYCGTRSLSILCIHTMDTMWQWVYQWKYMPDVISGFVRLLSDLAIFVALMYLMKKTRKR